MTATGARAPVMLTGWAFMLVLMASATVQDLWRLGVRLSS